MDDEDKGVTEMMTPGGTQKIPIINESGLYSLVLKGRHTGASDSMKFPCGLMCLSFRAAIPLRAVAIVQIH